MRVYANVDMWDDEGMDSVYIRCGETLFLYRILMSKSEESV